MVINGGRRSRRVPCRFDHAIVAELLAVNTKRNLTSIMILASRELDARVSGFHFTLTRPSLIRSVLSAALVEMQQQIETERFLASQP